MLESDVMKKIIEILLSKEVIGPIITIFVMFVLYKIIKRIIKRLFNFKTKKIKQKKQITLMNFFINVARIVVLIFASLIILEIYGVKTSAIIASLGAVTVVIGLAFQDILKDFIAGFSFIFEDSYNVGDWVTINDFKGEVISIGMKTTRIRAYGGEILIINNGSITHVINHTASNSLAIVDVNVSYDSDIDKVEEVLNNLCETLKENIETLKGDINLLGIEDLGDSAITFRMTAEVEAGTQFNVQRIMRKAVKLELDKNKIEIPYNQLVVHNERV